MTDKHLAERLRMLVREERDQGRIDESEAIELHRYINRTLPPDDFGQCGCGRCWVCLSK